MNAPHPLAFADTAGLSQLVRSYYAFAFQLPLLPELFLAAENFAFLDDALLGPPSAGMAVRRRSHPLCLNARDVEAMKWSLSRAGALTAAVNYYRNLFWGHAAYSHAIGLHHAAPPLDVETLLIWGDHDGALGNDSAPRTARYIADGRFTLRMIPDASHWVQQDAVEDVVAALAAFLRPRALNDLRDLYSHHPAGGHTARQHVE